MDYIKILTENPNGVMATRDNEMIKTRVFQYLFSDENKAYFCTSSQKPVASQMKQHPYVSFCTNLQNYCPVLSINGKVTFTDDENLKKKAFTVNPSLKQIYGSEKNPVFTLLYIDIEEIETFSYDEGPKKITLSK
ncbi:MAG: pyridoxamine 5-phosphate oxidase [Lachnospiraceae bacterium]|nr:pyridoxamine 5-phosphate oxidase [Lachnospiraceae bacterium]MBQ6993466.1 pyridoxamine 5-phosphate oxidase [Lachnospiraceae bacterium]